MHCRKQPDKCTLIRKLIDKSSYKIVIKWHIKWYFFKFLYLAKSKRLNASCHKRNVLSLVKIFFIREQVGLDVLKVVDEKICQNFNSQ